MGAATRPPLAARRGRWCSGRPPPARRSARRGASRRPRDRDGPVPGRDRADPEREDDEPGGARHSRLAWSRAGRQREERSPAAHAGDADTRRTGVVHRPDRQHRDARQYLVPLDRLRTVARGLPGSRRAVRGGQGRGHDGGRRVLVRHRGQAPRSTLRRRGPGPAHHGRRRALGRHPGGRRGGGHPGAHRAGGGAPCGPGDLVPRRPHTQRHLHHGRDGACPLRSPAAGAGVVWQLRAPPPVGRLEHPVSLRAGPRPAPAARLFHRADPGRVELCLHPRHEVRPTARPAAAGRARRGGAHRSAARARRIGRHLRVARDPDRHCLAGPRPGPGPLRGAGADGPQQPSGQALPARDRRSRHPRVRQPADRGRGGTTTVGHP